MEKLSSVITEFSTEGISRIKLNEPSTYNALSLNTLKSLITNFKKENIWQKRN